MAERVPVDQYREDGELMSLADPAVPDGPPLTFEDDPPITYSKNSGPVEDFTPSQTGRRPPVDYAVAHGAPAPPSVGAPEYPSPVKWGPPLLPPDQRG